MLETLVEKGIEPIRWLLVIGIAYTLAMTIWVFFETPVAMPVAANAGPGQAEVETPPVNINWILGKHIFGEAGAVVPEVTQSNQTAEITRLPLELQSVFVSDQPELSTAIVAQKGKPGKLYHIGENLPGNAKLVEVGADQIYLRRAGVREALPFPKSKPGQGFEAELVGDFDDMDEMDMLDDDNAADQAANARVSTPVAGVSREDDPLAAIEDYREQFAEDAEGTLDKLGIESTAEGGYRIGNLAQSAYLRQTGLQSGDVILSVNGQPVGDLQQDQMQLDNILGQGSARIEVQRGSRRFFITARIPNQR